MQALCIVPEASQKCRMEISGRRPTLSVAPSCRRQAAELNDDVGRDLG